MPKDIKVGEIDLQDKNTIFIPGSISSAVDAANEFRQSFHEKTGIKPSWINSQMSIFSYPAQFFSLKSAKERNQKVEEGIKNFIKDADKTKPINVFAHSAGSREAIKVLSEYSGKNTINFTSLGGGTPYGPGYENNIEKIKQNSKIQFTDIATDIDPVVKVGGLRNNSKIYIPATKEKQEIDNQKSRMDLHNHDSLGVDFSSLDTFDQQSAILATAFWKGSLSLLKTHYNSNYYTNEAIKVFKEQNPHKTSFVDKVQKSGKNSQGLGRL